VGSSHSAGEPDCAYLVRLEGSTMVLLHGFIKKTSATPKTDLDLAKDRFQLLRRSSS
jgi:phage-related protein